MPLKKKQFSDEEIAIFDEAVIYKRGEYWHFRMWLNGEGKYGRKPPTSWMHIALLGDYEIIENYSGEFVCDIGRNQ